MHARFRWGLSIRPLLSLAILSLSIPAFGQFGEAKGNLYGRTVDEHGTGLPGVSVVLSGNGARQDTVTDSDGRFRFLNLAPAPYVVTLSLSGFATVNQENVAVNVGQNTEITVPMRVSAVQETVTVRAVTPLIDTRKVQTGATMSTEELKEIPTARDPWVLLQSVGGVQIDRINVAGSESGQQSNFVSRGSIAGTFTMDGVNLTDVSTTGASNIYYDFDSFQEVQVITGGSDVSVQGSGPHLNMVTRRGTNDVHGSGRIYVVDKAFQSDNTPSELKNQNAEGVPAGAGNHIDSVQDYGAELGGPLWVDRMWLWGAYGRNQINLVTVGGTTDKTTLENFNAKLDFQLFPDNAFTAWYQRSNKIKFGRNAGPDHPQETTWDQTLPQNTWKFEDSQTFSANVFSSAMFSGQNGTFILAPEGGNQQVFRDANGIWHNSYEYFQQSEPQRQAKADTSVFFKTGSLDHELKFGFQYLWAAVHSGSAWPGGTANGLASATYGDLIDCGTGIPCAVITRPSSKNIETTFYSAFLSDTLTADRLTVNAGVRWDRQYGVNDASSIGANASFQDILPAVNYAGAGKAFTWEDFSPRVGVTYALGNDRRTILKASYAHFVDNLNTPLVGRTNPLGGVAYAYYSWNDANGDNLVSPGEVDTSPSGLQFPRGYDPANPGAVGSTPNGIAHNLKAPRTDEIVVGVDHALLPSLALGLQYTYRKYTDTLYEAPYYASTGRILNSGDYVQYDTLAGTTPDGHAFNIPLYEIDPAVLAANGGFAPGGTFVYNRPDFNESYHGIELSLNKQLADHWMARGTFTYQINKQHLGSGACADPNLLVNDTSTIQANYGGSGCRNGDEVAIQSTGSGSKDSVFLNSKWQFNVNFLYQLPLGFNTAANFFGRQGYPIVWFTQATGPDDGLTRNIQLEPTNNARYKDVYNLDLRVEKEITIKPGISATISADLFNALNSAAVLQRYNETDIDNVSKIKEIQSPRIWRFGLRVAF
jgi:hypothetical protein